MPPRINLLDLPAEIHLSIADNIPTSDLKTAVSFLRSTSTRIRSATDTYFTQRFLKDGVYEFPLTLQGMQSFLAFTQDKQWSRNCSIIIFSFDIPVVAREGGRSGFNFPPMYAELARLEKDKRFTALWNEGLRILQADGVLDQGRRDGRKLVTLPKGAVLERRYAVVLSMNMELDKDIF